MRHRHDIDGLRAIAVTAVVLYHTAPALVPQGLYGVDVFFVISGFLIARIIHDDSAAGRFSIMEFYRRRVRRIIPALFVVCAATTILAVILLFPADLTSYSVDLLSASAFVANITFYRHADYFAPAAESIPLLHLWSLSVEEQFYLAFPLVMVMAMRGRRPLTVLTVIGAASLGGFVAIGPADPAAAFYLLPFRAWELMLGAVTGVLCSRLPPPPRWTVALAWLGLGAIAFAVFRSTPVTPDLPGLAAMLACLGTAGILAFNAGTYAIRPLSWPPVVFVGLISYSLYLWHWPVFSLARYYLMGPPSPWLTALLIVGAAALAAVTWRFIEAPFRDYRSPGKTRPFAVATAALGGLGVVSLAVLATGGLPWRISAEAQTLAGYSTRGSVDFAKALRIRECLMGPDQGPADFDPDKCLSNNENLPSLLIWGDSYAAHYVHGLKVALPAAILQATASACPPVLGMAVEGRTHCRDLNDYFFGQAARLRPTAVALSATWGAVPLAEFDITVAKLRGLGLAVIIFGPSPAYSAPLPQILARHAQNGRRLDLARFLLPETLHAEDAMKARYQASPGVHYLSILDVLCPAGHCIALTPDGVPVAIDTGHLSPEGSVLVARQIKPVLLNLLPHH